MRRKAEKVTERVSYAWTGRTTDTASGPRVALRCVWHTRLVIEPAQVPSGTRYDVQPGGTIQAEAEDVDALLAMEHAQAACCGAVVSPAIKLFEQV